MIRTIGRFLVALFALVGLVAMLAALGLAWGGVGTHSPPSRLETRLSRAARHFLIPRAARAAPNPVSATSEVLADARAHFADHCAVCHGNDGRGETDFGRGLYPRVPDLTAPVTQELSDGELFFIIEKGVRLTGMPAFGGGEHEGEEESWALVRFIRHLPEITPEELAEMEDLNPKSREELEQEDAIRRFLQGGEQAPPPHRHDHDH